MPILPLRFAGTIRLFRTDGWQGTPESLATGIPAVSAHFERTIPGISRVFNQLEPALSESRLDLDFHLRRYGSHRSHPELTVSVRDAYKREHMLLVQEGVSYDVAGLAALGPRPQYPRLAKWLKRMPSRLVMPPIWNRIYRELQRNPKIILNLGSVETVTSPGKKNLPPNWDPELA